MAYIWRVVIKIITILSISYECNQNTHKTRNTIDFYINLVKVKDSKKLWKKLDIEKTNTNKWIKRLSAKT